ncbi:MAG: tRNA (adenosine(37)-N6)-threonylcarbamoyltransferase complex ATPase subunit type 1 TsaE [Nevskiaceae bacterium]
MSALVLRSADDTTALGAAVASALSGRGGAVICLRGPLGAGKTTVARGVLRALGVRGAIRSPTYTLLEPYEIADGIAGAGRGLVHLDLYRLKDETELEPLGLRDYPPEQWWWLIEWPERAAQRLPPADLVIALGYAPTGRRAELGGPLAGPVAARFMPD